MQRYENLIQNYPDFTRVDRTKAECTHSNCKLSEYYEENLEPCSHKMIQVVIVVLIFIMAIWFVLFARNDTIKIMANVITTILVSSPVWLQYLHCISSSTINIITTHRLPIYYN